MKTRILTVEELEIVKNLAYRIWPIAYKEILSQEQLEFMLNWMYSIQTLQENLRNGHFYFAISMNEQDVGFLDLEPNNPIEGNMKIQKIYVLPEFQGMGLGNELMKQAFNFAKENQMNSMTLQVNRNNKAVEFYKKFGFEIIDEQDFDIGNGYYMNDFIMRFKIN
jgi:ribosomal protein S18 acetylase RimI-like enzyme